MQLIPENIPGAFTLPNSPPIQVVAGNPDPFSLTKSLSEMAAFYFQSQYQQDILKQQSEIAKLKATQTERIFATKGAQMLGTGIIIVGLALVLYALRGK